MEYATIFSALGVPVTIVDAAPRLAAMMDAEISERLRRVFEGRGTQVVLGTGLVSVRRDEDELVAVLVDGRQLRSDTLLFAAGRSVDTSTLGLDHVGIDVDRRGRIVVDERRQTTCASVFAAGDVTGPTLASMATDQGRQAVCGAFDLDFSAHTDPLPASAVYGLPEVARAGLSEQDCVAQDTIGQPGQTLGTEPSTPLAGGVHTQLQVRGDRGVAGTAGGGEHDPGADPVTVLGTSRAGPRTQHRLLSRGEHDNERAGDHHQMVVADLTGHRRNDTP